MPVHEFRPQETPVKLLTANCLRPHLRHGFPDLSRARRPALIAPWFAFGPSLWFTPAGAVGLVLWSMVPSSLQIVSIMEGRFGDVA